MNNEKINKIISKLPEITLIFRILKICATTLGETAGDLLAQTLGVGYGTSALILISIFIITLIIQLRATKFHPRLYWTVILSTSTAGTVMSDYMDRTLGLGYMYGSMILIAILVIILSVRYWSEGSLSVENVRSQKAEIFYRAAILFSNTLGTAFGDFLADSSGLGFGGGAALITGLILVIIWLKNYSKISPIMLFWAAFILTRPWGATLGDFLSKSVAKGGLGFGTYWTSGILLIILVGLVIYQTNINKLESDPVII